MFLKKSLLKSSFLYLLLILPMQSVFCASAPSKTLPSFPQVTKIDGLVGNFSFKIGMIIKNLQKDKLYLENPKRNLSRESTSTNLFLYGKKGCGKTTLAKAIADESGAKLIDRSAATLVKTEFDKEAGEVGELFRTVREYREKYKQPVVLFIDEAHLLVKAVDGKTRLGATALWLELDKIKNELGVVVILASNTLEGVSKPLLDRFSFVVEIINLDEQLRQDLFEVLWFKHRGNQSIDVSLMKKLVKESKGLSIRGIEKTMERSFMKAKGQGLNEPSEQMLLDKLNAVKAEELGTWEGFIKNGANATGSFVMGVLKVSSQVAGIVVAFVLLRK